MRAWRAVNRDFELRALWSVDGHAVGPVGQKGVAGGQCGRRRGA
jgi:hypothetical protein